MNTGMVTNPTIAHRMNTAMLVFLIVRYSKEATWRKSRNPVNESDIVHVPENKTKKILVTIHFWNFLGLGESLESWFSCYMFGKNKDLSMIYLEYKYSILYG